MPIPSAITDLSTTAASNSPAGTESSNEGDNHIRQAYAFIAENYQNKAPKASPTFTGVVTIPAGTAAAPSLTFTGDTNTGVFASAANEVAITAAGVAQFKITAAGIYGTDIHNNATSPTGTTNQYIASGTYTPTGTGTLNVDSLTEAPCQWMRVGNVVTVSGTITVDPTAASLTGLRITLPIASNMSSYTHLAGVGADNATVPVQVRITGDTTNDEATFSYVASQTGSSIIAFTFTYVVL